MGNGDGDEKGARTIQNHEQEERRLGHDLQLMCTLRGGGGESSSTSEEGEDERDGDENGELCFPHEVLEHVLGFIKGHKDRNSVSAVCKSWFKVEACCREHVFIGNCYAASPSTMIKRFPKVKSLTLKGKPRFADFNLVPRSWGAYACSWVSAMGPAYPKLESLCLKRMTITDNDLSLIATSFLNFKDLTLFYCEGFSTSGLALIVAKCRELRRLDLNEDDITDNGVDWLSCFPEKTTTLECLAFDCLDSPVNFDALEKLVARSPSLKELRLNSSVSIVQLNRLMLRSSQLTHLGTGCFSHDFVPEQATSLQLAFNNCKSLESLSGFQDVVLEYLPAIYPVCNNLTDLNLGYAVIDSGELEQIVSKCPKLQRLWVLDSVEDAGLRATAATCKDLRELRVFPIDAREDGQGSVSDVGLAAIAEGCPNLQSILYFCQRMTNAAVVTMSKNCPKLASFRLCIMGRHKPDHVTGEPMDEGFCAIVMNCKKLTRLAVSGLLTNKTFEYIGTHGKSLETLSVAFAGDNDMAMKYVLDGCKHLRKLEIRDSPFGDYALLSGLHHYENMRFLWMSSCKVSLEGCMELARRMPSLNVEIIRENGNNDDTLVEKLYAYRSVSGRRNDMPSFVTKL